MADRPTRYDLVTCGEALAAFVAPYGQPLAGAEAFRRTVAGAEANVAIGMARLGHRVAFAGRVGSDTHGALIARFLRSEKVDGPVLVDPERSTGMLARDTGSSGPVEVVYGRAGSAGAHLRSADLPLLDWRHARAVHVTGITAVLSSTACQAVADLVEHGCDQASIVALDPNIRRRLAPIETFMEALLPLLDRVTVVIAGADELQSLTGLSNPEDSVPALLRRSNIGLVIVKRGADGAYADDGRTRWEVNSRARAVVDPVGAGDAFAAGVLSALLEGRSVPSALDRGSWVAAAVVGTHGDVEGLPHRHQLDAMLANEEMTR